MRVHDHDSPFVLAVLQHADGEDTRERCVPRLRAGDLRCFREPERAAAEEREDGGAVKDRRVFARVDAVVAADSDGSPLGCVERRGVSGAVQTGEDVEELGVQHFLQADDGGGHVLGVEVEGGEEAGKTDGPRLLAAEGGGGGVADVVG